ncbi:uncharacterized protein LOC135471069 [Liolophura sinensis]|uniref:uncharacterized protein LOC135471069 n=1 Tax=Liolophura sinensis TaxID=3198878 RepID=UPI003158FC95
MENATVFGIVGTEHKMGFHRNSDESSLSRSRVVRRQRRLAVVEQPSLDNCDGLKRPEHQISRRKLSHATVHQERLTAETKRRHYSTSFIPGTVSSVNNSFPASPALSDVTSGCNGVSYTESKTTETCRFPKDHNSNSSRTVTSCPDGDNYKKFDIVGESFEARFPWQRDVSVQCSLKVHCVRRRCCKFRFAKEESDSDIDSCLSSDDDGKSETRIRSSELVPTEKRLSLAHRRPYTKLLSHPPFQKVRHKFSDSSLYRRPVKITVPKKLSLQDRPSMNLEDVQGSGRTRPPDSLVQNGALSEDEYKDESLSTVISDFWKLRRGSQDDVLPSPRISPEPWGAVPELVVTWETDHKGENHESAQGDRHLHKETNLLHVPKRAVRRPSLGSLTSGSEESDCEPSPPVARRGRRAAIFDSKNFGDVSPTSLSPDVSPSNSCDEGDSSGNPAERFRRRRSSVDLTMSIYPGDLLVQEHHKKLLLKRNTIADFAAVRHGSTVSVHEDSKKPRQTFSLLKLMKTKSKESLTHLEDILAHMKVSEFKDNHLAAYKTTHWSDLIASTDKEQEPICLHESEQKRREAVWELFRSECVFLIDHLMVLKHCFMEPLKKVQVEGFLMYAEPRDIFGNLDELCYVSYTFCKDFISALLKDMSITDFGRTKVLIKAFQRFSALSRDGGVYHTYCLNYMAALNYLEQLRKSDEFAEFEKFCEQDSRCNRLQLTDLLVAPMQHCTKLPLLLANIRKYTPNYEERTQLTESIEKVENSLKKLEDKMKWLKNYERVQEIQQQLVWPPVTDLDPKTYIPEFLRSTLLRQPCERLLASPKRQLIFEGPLALVESAKNVEMHLFLFDDILLLTKLKKPARKKTSVYEMTQRPSLASPMDLGSYIVYRQPVPLDRFSVHDVSQPEGAAPGLKQAFVLVHISRYQQIIGVYTLQACTDASKMAWINQLREAQDNYNEGVPMARKGHGESPEAPRKHTNNNTSSSNRNTPEKTVSSPRGRMRLRTLKQAHNKSRSVDAVTV